MTPPGDQDRAMATLVARDVHVVAQGELAVGEHLAALGCCQAIEWACLKKRGEEGNSERMCELAFSFLKQPIVFNPISQSKESWGGAALNIAKRTIEHHSGRNTGTRRAPAAPWVQSSRGLRQRWDDGHVLHVLRVRERNASGYASCSRCPSPRR